MAAPMPALPAELPNIAKARLPATYEGAKNALANCTRIDECQEWADKAEALASYAKQAQDDELRKMADRIQARAIRRCGELLNQIKERRGSRTDLEPSPGRRDQVDPVAFFKEPVSILAPLTRSQVAEEAGLSRRQHHTALRVARVPHDEFDDAVESQEPPTVTALAERGRLPAAPRVDHLQGRNPADFRAATALLGLLHHINRAAAEIDIHAAVRGLTTRETDDALTSLAAAERWVERVASILRG